MLRIEAYYRPPSTYSVNDDKMGQDDVVYKADLTSSDPVWHDVPMLNANLPDPVNIRLVGSRAVDKTNGAKGYDRAVIRQRMGDNFWPFPPSLLRLPFISLTGGVGCDWL